MQKARPQRSWLARRWWLLVLLLLILPATLARIAVDPATVAMVLQQLLRDGYALQLHVDGGAELHVFPRPRLALKQARLTDLNGQALAQLQRLQVDLPWDSLWTRPPALGRISISDVRIQGGAALQAWLDQWQSGPPAPQRHWPKLVNGISARRVVYDEQGPLIEGPVGRAQGPGERIPGERGPGERGPGERGPGERGPGERGPADRAQGPEEQGTAGAVAEGAGSGQSSTFSAIGLRKPALTSIALDYLELAPLFNGSRLDLEFAVRSDTRRLALRLAGDARELDGAMRIASATVELAIGNLAEDQELRAEGQLDLSWLPAGGLRGSGRLKVDDPAWIGALTSLALSGPIAMEFRMSGSESYQTDLDLDLRGDQVQLSGRWPIGGDALAREAFLRGDYHGTDGIVVEGLELVRQPPKIEPANTKP